MYGAKLTESSKTYNHGKKYVIRENTDTIQDSQKKTNIEQQKINTTIYTD
jgi:hypothetical protein